MSMRPLRDRIVDMLAMDHTTMELKIVLDHIRKFHPGWEKSQCPFLKVCPLSKDQTGGLAR